MGLPMVFAGKAIYENRITLKEIEKYFKAPSNSPKREIRNRSFLSTTGFIIIT